jgi:hypothetical protein
LSVVQAVARDDLELVEEGQDVHDFSSLTGSSQASSQR